MNNLLTNLPSDQPDEIFEELVRGRALRVERIVSHGHVTPVNEWYDQGMDEWVLVLSGAARLRFENQTDEVELRPGDYLNIPAHRRHRVEWTDPEHPTVWLAIHYEQGDEGQAPIDRTA